MASRSLSKRRKLALAVLGGATALLALNTVVAERETREAEAGVGRLVEVTGQELQVRVSGRASRPAVVLVHGLGGSIHLWERLTPLLDDDYRLIAIDLLGHGGSDKPREGYGPARQARLIAGTLEALHVEDALVVGHSLGGIVGVALAEEHEQLLRGLVLIGTPALSSDVDLPAAARIATRPIIGPLLHRVLTEEMLEDALQDSVGDDVDVPDQFVEDFRAMTYSSYADSYNEAAAYSEDEPLHERMAGTELPLLVLIGAEDEQLAENAIAPWREAPEVDARLLAGRGHTPQWEDPARIARLIHAFDRRLAR